jgi:NADH-quinone oxidoreductase subunit C
MTEARIKKLCQTLKTHGAKLYQKLELKLDEVTLTVQPDNWIALATLLKEHQALDCAMLIDLCGIDYLHYGQGEWTTHTAADQGFSRARQPIQPNTFTGAKGRFAVVYHLLSLTHRHRVRVIVRLPKQSTAMMSVCNLWPAANWFERETFDLFGIEFSDHPDLRRILTDYGFIGHPFRKDFPVHGKVELRYDAKLEQCVYEPVSIKKRNVIPKIIRTDDARYQHKELYEQD